MSKHTWDFNSNTSLEALAAWEAYYALPVNQEWHGENEQDAFTAGFDAARSVSPITDAANQLAARLDALNETLRYAAQGKRTVGL